MKQKVLVGAVVLALLCSFLALGQGVMARVEYEGAERVPEVVSYQGRVTIDGAVYNGLGYFKFAVVDWGAATSYWSNDGTSSAGSQPASSVALTVTDGTFSVLLGDAPMQALSTGAFSGPDRALRVWFSPDGVTFSLLAPDRVIASVPFALQAEQAANANTLDSLDSSAFQRRVNGTCPHGYAVLQVLSDGTVTCEAVEARPGFAITTLDSQGWEGFYTSLAIGADGLGLIAYRDDDTYDLKVAHCENIACTDFTINPIVSYGDVGIRPSLVIGPDGLGLISFLDNTGTSALKLAHCDNLACTSATVNTVDTYYTGRFNSLVIGADGLPLISYSQEINDNFDLKVAHCNDLLCSSATLTPLDTADEVGLHNAITIGSDGLGLIGYQDFTHQTLKIAHCDDLACTSASIITPDPGGSGRYTAITVGADGLGLIVSGGNVLHCNDRACSSAAVYTLDAADMGYNAITTGPDGLGLVSYYSPQGLKVAHCDNLECSSASLSVVDGSGDMIYTSIAVGVDGLGLVSYADQELGDLKVAHLSNPLGTPWTQR